MKKIALLITLTTLLANQAFGAALCPSICDNMKKDAVESAPPSCHQEQTTEQPSQEMPTDCNIMVMLDALSAFNISSNALEVSKFDLENTLFLTTEESQLNILAFTDPGIAVYSESPPVRKQPIYILIQSFLI